MTHLSPILTIKSVHSICGGGVKVIGEKKKVVEIGQNVKIVSANNSFFASVIDFNILSQTIELSLENFRENELKIGMQVFKTN
ncbi:MAG: hypothetical protein ACPIA4_05475 [Flavobacteriales bacterium]|nr:hypothetical protein [Flavobacteriia bacterium]